MGEGSQCCGCGKQIDALKKRDDQLHGAVRGVADFLCFDQGVFGYCADTGEPGANQTAVVAALDAMAPDHVFMGGDNVYSPATVNSALDPFAQWLNASQLWPAFGNHDWQDADIDDQLAKFPYLPYKQRYYHQHFAKGNLDLLTISTGVYGGAIHEPDGLASGSIQANFFLNSIIPDLTGKWRVAMAHHPPVTARSAGSTPLDDYVDEYSWILPHVDLLLVGHGHMNWAISKNGTEIVNCSSGVRGLRPLSGSNSLYGDNDGAWLRYSDDTERMVGKIIANQKFLRFEFWLASITGPGNVPFVRHAVEIPA